MAHKGWLAFFIGCLCLLCSGCMDIIELREQSFVVGLGIDQAEDNQIEVSLAEIDIEKSGKEQDKSIPYLVKSAKCKHISECMRILRTEQFKKLTLSKVTYIVFGEAIAEKGIAPFSDFVARSNELDLSIQLFVAKNSAKDLFKADNGKLLELTTKGYRYLPTFIPSYLWQMCSRVGTPLESTYLNRVHISKDKLTIDGSGFMLLDKLKVNLDYKETRATNILLDKMWKDILLFLDSNEDTSFNIKKVKRKEQFAPDHVLLTYSITGNIVETNMKRPMSQVKQLEKSGAEYLTEKITEILKKNTKEGIDVIGIGEKFRQRGWDTSNWQQRIQELPIDIQVDLHILDGGALRE